MRLLAAAADEPAMIQIFKDGKDIHMGNAVLVFGKSLAAKFKREVTYESFLWAKKMDKKIKEAKKDNLPLPCSQEDADFCKALMNARLAVKTIGFGLIYGLREKALARRIECTVEEALELTAAFMATYPAIMSFCAEAVASVHEDSFAFTLMGRRRYLPLIHSSRNMDQWRAERQAKNTPIQGTAAEVAAGAMNRIYHEGLEDIFDCKMLFQVHDELVFECREDQADAAYAWIKERMEHPFKQDLSVPLLAEGGIGKNWADAKA
jgi:DNA polymerase I-like protein with 3'-5' exonuclease and polymerase domains